MNQFEILSQDMRYALRSILRQPGLAIATVLTLTFGLGLNVSAFTFIQGLLFRARVDKDPQNFVHLSPEYRNAQRHALGIPLISPRDYRAYKEQAHTLSSLTAWGTGRATIGAQDSGSQLALLVTRNFFDVYGLNAPRFGRIFTADECDPDNLVPVALLSEEIWRNQFNADPSLIGGKLRMNRTQFTVVGILPAGFSGRLRGPGIWIPWSWQPLFLREVDPVKADTTAWLNVEGRLKPERTKTEASAELAVITAQLDGLEPGRKTTLTLTNGSFGEEPSLRPKLFWIEPVVMGALTLILLIACTNVTVLQLSRAVTRKREMGIRLSIGAGKTRLLRTLLTEMLLLSAVAGVISIYVAFKSGIIFETLLGNGSTPTYQTKPDLLVLVYMGIVILFVTLAAGLSPAGESLRVDLHNAMKTGGSVGGSAKGRRNFLVASQVAMGLVLLACAGLFVRAEYALSNSDPGFETHRVLFVTLDRPQIAVVNRIREIPGVASVAAGIPFGSRSDFAGQEEVRDRDQTGPGRQASVSTASTTFFETMNIPMLRGRSAANSHEVVVSQALVQELWTGKDPLSATVVLNDGTLASVVGVARDIQSEHPGSLDGPHLYRWRDIATLGNLLIQFHGDALDMAGRVRDAIRQIDPDGQASPVTLQSLLDSLADRFSEMIRMVGILAGIALSLAVLGIYGVVAFTVSQRTKELGIRIALGATKPIIIRLVLRTGIQPILWGIVAGLPLALLAAQAVAEMLRQTPAAIQPRDPVVFIAVAWLLATVAIAAMLRPAWRGAQVDPMLALREE